MSNISLNLYRIFCVVAQSKSYAEASEKLNITPSTISSSITKLESLLDTKLFDRNIDGVTLTKIGEELFKLIDTSIETIDFAEKIMLDKTDLSNGEITIGCQSHIAIFYVMELIEKAKKEYPNLKINIIGNMNSDEMIDILRNRKVDFLIMHIMPESFEDKRIYMKQLKIIENIFVCNKPIEIKEFGDFNKYEYILSSSYTRTYQELQKVLTKYNIKLESKITCDITEVRIDAAKRNLGIAYVMKDSVKKDIKQKELYEVKIPIKLPKFDIKLVYNKGQQTNVSKKFIQKYIKSEY